MANWCSTHITLNCNNEDDAKFVFKNIENWISYTNVKNSWGNNWLGNVLVNSGLYTTKDLNTPNIPRCRGEIAYLDISVDQVIIETETAWTPMLQMWREICDNLFPEKVNEIIYMAEEPGCELYFTNDPAEDDNWVLDTLENTLYGLSESQLREALLEYLPKEVREWHDHDEIHELAELCRKMLTDEDDYLSIHKFEFVPISELC